MNGQSLNDACRALAEAESRLAQAITTRTDGAAEAYERRGQEAGDIRVAGLIRVIEQITALALAIEEGDYDTARTQIVQPASVFPNADRSRWFVAYTQARTKTQRRAAGDDGYRQPHFPTADAALNFVLTRLEVVA